MGSLRVLRPGMLTTVQDLGRWGCQGTGVPVGGPMDPYSHRVANRLVDNDENAAALEITLLGPELEANGNLVCAVAGAAFALSVDGRAVAMHEPFTVEAGARLRFGPRGAGTRATLAVQGGFDVEAPFGSRSTSLISRIGPFGGRPLQTGDELPVGHSRQHRSWGRTGPGTGGKPPIPLNMPRGGARVRVIRGPHEQMFTGGAYETLFESRFEVTAASNRMGYRLDGPALQHAGGADILSDATPPGSIQVPASGKPILLMADRQTTGGYPRMATVISADIPYAGQLAPGDWIEFVPCGRAAAIEALKAQRARLDGRN